MRLHQLVLQAFGPFPEREVIDFDQLNDSGLFLVTGPTGAGKTSVLDGVCFALFGQVPGSRGVKSLRSDHARPEARPEVTLDFTLAGRRFVVRRSPEWQRPKRRGHGTTLEKAAASLLEIVAGEERLLTSRAQEVGHFLSDLLGMTAAQFQQVAMLPQGEFQTFLRATSQERHDVLQQLFRTERFTRIEDWVHDHSRQLRLRAADGESRVRRLVDTMADRAGVETPAQLQGEALAHSASAGQLLPWAEDLVDTTGRALQVAADERQRASEVLERARDQHDQATRLADLQAIRAQAQRVLASLDDETAERARDRLAGDARALPVAPVLRLLQASSRALDQARGRRELLAEADLDDSQAALEDARSTLARLESLRPRELELSHTRSALEAATSSLTGMRARLHQSESEWAALPARREAVHRRREAATEAASRLEPARSELEQARTKLAAAAAVPDAEQRLMERRAAAAQARDDYADARERLLDVIERRLAGMAAELANGLAEGVPCQVCGSLDHPAPARSAGDAVDRTAQLAATAETDARRATHEAAVARVQEAELELAELRRESTGLSPAEAATAVDSARAAADAAETAVAELTAVEADLALLEADESRVEATLRDLQVECTRLETSIEALRRTAAQLDEELAAALGGRESLAQAVQDQHGLVTRLCRLGDARAAVATAEAEFARLQVAVADAARGQGFASVDEVRAALLTDPVRNRLADQVRAYDDARADAERVLADPALASVPDEPVDIAVARRLLDEAATADSEAARRHHLCQERAEALAGQSRLLADALDDWAPARDGALTADSLAKLVRGMGSDNQLQLRLSSYVLATRLDQVLAAANERLTHMREQRYLLVRTGDAARKGSQAGLGLRVVDEWTGEERDPATLSGGETFVVSLALALGLSDVVSSESGGVHLATLFIDEGFGMLDLETLDDVMDRLDGLRAGGRTVGVVSHVTELRNRIPTQLHVDKQRRGSSVRITTLVG